MKRAAEILFNAAIIALLGVGAALWAIAIGRTLHTLAKWAGLL